MISAKYPQESVDKIIWALDAALDYDVAPEDDVDLIRDFLVSISKLSRGGGLVVCKEKDYSRLSDAEDKLLLLQGYGVDNWDGYGDAMEEFHAMKEAEGE